MGCISSQLDAEEHTPPHQNRAKAQCNPGREHAVMYPYKECGSCHCPSSMLSRHLPRPTPVSLLIRLRLLRPPCRAPRWFGGARGHAQNACVFQFL